MPVCEMKKIGSDGVNGVVVFTFLGGLRTKAEAAELELIQAVKNERGE